MAVLSSQSIVRAGLSPAYASAAGGGDSFANTGKEFLHVKNDDASSKTVTIVTQSTVDGLSVSDRTVTVPAGESRMIGPFQTAIYNDDNSRVNVTYSAVTSVTVAVFKFVA